MEFLFIELMQWGRQEGFQWFNLGMAPLSGVDDRPLAPLWNRAVHLAYQFGDRFYSFEGLRKYKEKYNPVWRPKISRFTRRHRAAAHPRRPDDVDRQEAKERSQPKRKPCYEIAP